MDQAKKQTVASLFWDFIENEKIRSEEQRKLVQQAWGLKIQQPKEHPLQKQDKK